MAKHILSIDPLGGVYGLQAKPKKGVDFREMGHAEINRVSDIVWDETRQKWTIKALRGPLAGRLVLWGDYLGHKWSKAPGASPQGDSDAPKRPKLVHPASPMLFDDYDEAVKVEIELFSGMQTEGKDITR